MFGNCSEDEFVIQVTLFLLHANMLLESLLYLEKKSLMKYLTDCSSNKYVC